MIKLVLLSLWLMRIALLWACKSWLRLAQLGQKWETKWPMSDTFPILRDHYRGQTFPCKLKHKSGFRETQHIEGFL